MGKSFISVFLSMLFSIAIAFPGYGKSVFVKQNNSNNISRIKSTENQDFNLYNFVKKCLLNGISIIEEDRPVEESQNEIEDEHSSGVEESLLITRAVAVQYNLILNIKYYRSDVFLKSVALMGVPEPPPESIL